MPQLEAGIKGNQEVQQMLSAMGWDSFKDVTNFTMAASGASDHNWMIVVHSRFDLARIHAGLAAFAAKQADAVTIHKHGEVPFYEMRKPMQSAHVFYGAFVDKETMVVSPGKDYVVAAMDRIRQEKRTTLDKHLTELLTNVDGKQSLWLAALVPDQLKNSLPQDKQTMDLAKKVKSFRAGITLTDGVQLAVRIETPDAKAARDVRQTLVGIQSILILAVTSNDNLKDFGPTLTDIINAIKFTLDKTTVGMDLNISAKQIEEGFKK